MRGARLALAALALSSLAACRDEPTKPEAVSCPFSMVPTISAVVHDAATNAPLAANSLVIARGSAIEDTLRFWSGTTDTLGISTKINGQRKAGTFTVTITREGYLPFQQVVTIEATQCGLGSVTVEAALVHA